MALSFSSLASQPGEILSSGPQLLWRSQSHSHHGNSLQGMTEGAEEKKEAETYQGVSGESRCFHKEGFESLNYWVIARLPLYMGCVISGNLL